MNSSNRYINIDTIKDMMYGDDDYVKEFASAAIQSFEEFSEQFRKHLLARDENNFRKAGHKIKPAAQMLHVQEIVDEYERAKTLLQEEEEQEQLQMSASNMKEIVDQVLKELKEIA